jgi:dephospho-CoA kinase
MKIVGLTGGIASGKSTVSAILVELGAEVIDADKLAREVVRPGRPAYHRVVAHFGEEILLPDGNIDRKALGDVVFHDAAQKAILDGIVHPDVSAATSREIALIQKRRPEALVVLDVPLLFEAGLHEGLSAIIVVYAPEDLQRQRLMQRDGISADEADARIHAQMSIEEKRRRATSVIDNSGDRSHLRRQVVEMFYRLLA